MRAREKITKEQREQILSRYHGRCAYCGRDLSAGRWQVDRIVPIYRGWSDEALVKLGLLRGSGCMENLAAACNRCNRLKSAHTIEVFRSELEQLLPRLRRYSPAFRLAEDLRLVTPHAPRVVFEFERNPPLPLVVSPLEAAT